MEPEKSSLLSLARRVQGKRLQISPNHYLNQLQGELVLQIEQSPKLPKALKLTEMKKLQNLDLREIPISPHTESKIHKKCLPSGFVSCHLHNLAGK